jgi:hypothetical protein
VYAWERVVEAFETAGAAEGDEASAAPREGDVAASARRSCAGG